ncbi:MAG: glycosyltransferase family 2 protein [Bacteroidia bacterium]|nr:glycosyltransferase family 2 protein [Bacteroidia bacterium]
MNVSVIIPCLNAASMLEALVVSLRGQTRVPDEILVVDSDSTDGTPRLAQDMGCTVLAIARRDFNHGGTRNLASRHARGDILVFMTQDALPVDSHFLEQLLDPILSGTVTACFARQVPYPNATLSEEYARAFNYPPVSQIRTQASVQSMGLGAYFFSNVSSAIRKDVFMDVGMFAEDVIMNEDMLLCAKLLDSGHAISYVAEARVYHSHDYSLIQSFKRYFDIGVFFSRHFKLSKLSTNARGAAYTRGLLVAMVKKRDALAFLQAFAEICTKYAGFNLGKLERFIPLKFKKYISMHAGYWKPTHRNKVVL